MLNSISDYNMTWILYLLFNLVFFATVEGKALFNKQLGDTLSERIRAWWRLTEGSDGYQVRRVAWVVSWSVFSIWFGYLHIPFNLL